MAVGLLIWTLYNFFSAGVLALQQHLEYWDAFMSAGASNYAMALMSIPLWSFCKRFPLDKEKIVATVILDTIVCSVLSVVWLVAYYGIHWLFVHKGAVMVMLSTRIYLWQLLDGLTKFALILGIFYTIQFYQKLKKTELREAELDLLTKDMELQHLKTQINPHFLFNALNSVNALMGKEPEKARTMNSKLSQLLRTALEGQDSKFVKLSEELAFARTYLDIEKVRFGDKLRVDEAIDASVLDQDVPAMLLQPLVENAIKHGIAKQAHGGLVQIKLARFENTLDIKVINSGSDGSSKATATAFERGIGLKNTRQRLARIYENAFVFEIDNGQPDEFCAHIQLPLTPNHPEEKGPA